MIFCLKHTTVLNCCNLTTISLSFHTFYALSCLETWHFLILLCCNIVWQYPNYSETTFNDEIMRIYLLFTSHHTMQCD